MNLCWLFGHKYRRIARVSASADKVGCSRCGREWGMHHGVRALVPWDEVRELYAPDSHLSTLKGEGNDG